jgi:hypothetical protein
MGRFRIGPQAGQGETFTSRAEGADVSMDPTMRI